MVWMMVPDEVFVVSGLAELGFSGLDGIYCSSDMAVRPLEFSSYDDLSKIPYFFSYKTRVFSLPKQSPKSRSIL